MGHQQHHQPRNQQRRTSSTTDPRRFPKTLRVYRTWNSLFRRHEKLVGQVPLQQVNGLAPTPLCGGKYGPCPEGVTP